MAERASRTTVAHLCAALDSGELVLERDGLRGRFASRVAVVALDEGLDEEGAADSLLDRLALAVDLHMVGIHDVDDPRYSGADIEAARRLLPAVTCTPTQLQTLAGVAISLGVDSPRALLLANRATRAIAALAGRGNVIDDDLAAATRLALAHRATRLPLPEEVEDEPESPPPEENGAPEGQAEEQASTSQPPPEQLLEAAAAAIPPGLLARLQSGIRPRRNSASQGKSGAQQRHRLRGRPAGVLPGDPRGGARLNLVATLRAAAPWQKLRRNATGYGGVVVQRQDFRLVRYRQRSESTTIFVVDASGSAALHRLAEAKGAVELLLADCYVRRDQVALIAFRGSGAELLLPPTRSLVRARRCLASLPGGGGTPLAGAIDMTAALADQVQRRGGTPCYVLLTDGRANICRDGRRGRDEAMGEALASGAGLRQLAVQGMVIDTSPRPHGGARDLAEAMGALYLALPHADAASLRDAVQANAR
jgi:magnesium chelatase subunit D